MLHNIIFLHSSRPEDQIWLPNPKVGDVVKVNMLTNDELEYWTITKVETNIVYVEKL